MCWVCDQPMSLVYIQNEALKLGTPSRSKELYGIPGLANLVTQTQPGDMGFTRDLVNLAAVMFVIDAADRGLAW